MIHLMARVGAPACVGAASALHIPQGHVGLWYMPSSNDISDRPNNYHNNLVLKMFQNKVIMI